MSEAEDQTKRRHEFNLVLMIGEVLV